MPGFIAHMLISDDARERLRNAPRAEDPAGQLQSFVRDVLDKHCNYMRLGALGPDLPYYLNPSPEAIAEAYESANARRLAQGYHQQVAQERVQRSTGKLIKPGSVASPE